MRNRERTSIRRFKSIRTRLALTFVLIVLLPMAVIGTVVAISGSEGAQTHLTTQLEMASSIKENAIAAWVATLKTDLGEMLIGSEVSKALAIPITHSQDRDRIREGLGRILAKTSHFNSLALWDREGQLLASTDPAMEGENHADQLRSLKEPTVHPVLLGGIPTMMAMRPVFDEQGRTLGYLGGSTHLKALEEILAEPKGLGQTGRAYLLNRNDILLTALPKAKAGSRMLNAKSSQGVRTLGLTKGTSYLGIPVNAVYRWLPELQALLITEQEQSESSRSILVLLSVYAGVALAAVLVAIFTALNVTHHIATPLVDLSETADEIAAGNLNVMAEIAREDEIGALAHSFNTMTENLRRMVIGLRESEEKYRGIFENALEGIFQSTLEGRFLKVNPATVSILGYDSPDDLLNRHLDITHEVYVNPEDRDRMISGLLATGQVNSFETLMYRMDHRKIWVSLNTRLVRDQAGEPLFIEGMIVDITERKEHEEERRKHREHLEELVDERTATLRDTNLQLQEEIVERKLIEEALKASRLTLAELNQSLEERIRKSVVELRQMDQLLISQSRQAAMGEMIGHIAHQWRQPLNTLGLVLSNLEDALHFDELNPELIEKSVADGNRLIQKMSSTINDFRDFFRPDKEKTAFSALEQIRATSALVEASFRNNHIAIQIEASEDFKLLGFPNEYSQVLLNLMNNAKQAIVESKVDEGRVTLLLTEENGLGCVRIRDNGDGIPDDILERIFEPYFSTKEMGTGIGLYMSKQIIERNMGGSIQARNLEEGGAEFIVLTPFAGKDV